MFDLAGVIATRSLGELVDTAALLSCQPLPAGNRVAIIANAGGAGALAADACADHGLQVVQLGAATQRALRALLPPAAVVTGPVDTCAVVTTEAFRACLEEVAADDGVDALLAVAVPTAFSDVSAAVAEAVISKPLAVAFLDRAESVRRLKRRPVPLPPPGSHADTGPAGGPPAAGPAAAVIDVAAAAITGVPCYADPDNAARALRHAVRYRAWRGRQRGMVPELDGLRPADARALVTGFLAGSPDGGWLPEASAAELVSCYGIPLAATLTAASEQEAAAAAAQLGGPVVLKAEAEGLVHRTGAGGVRVDLRTPREVAEGYRMLVAGSGLRLQRVLVQPMLDRRRRGDDRRGAGTRIRAAGGVRIRRRGHRGARRSRDPADPADRHRRRGDDPRGARHPAAGRRPGHAPGGHRRARGRAAAGLPARR